MQSREKFSITSYVWKYTGYENQTKDEHPSLNQPLFLEIIIWKLNFKDAHPNLLLKLESTIWKFKCEQYWQYCSLLYRKEKSFENRSPSLFQWFKGS